MLIEITYNVTDVYMSTTETPVYVEISFEQPGGTSAVWGSITGTLSNQTDLQTALDLKVPYSGATGNVNLGEYELKAGQLTLDVSPTGTAAVGTTRWNDTTGVSETTLKGGNVLLRNGVDLVARVVNKVTPNTTLTKAAYQAVRVSGAQGQRLAVELAQANNDTNSADTIGLVIETIPTNQEGFIMAVGQLENINTTGSLQGETWVDGDVLYLSPTTAGAITNVKPTGNGHIVVIGYVEYAHANNGKIYVKVMNGWELDELHDVSIVSVANNEALIYESATSLWKNKTIATALGYTPANAATTLTINGVTYDLSTSRTWTISAGISGTIATGQVAYATAANTIGGSNNLFWDAANSRLGIGTNTPTNELEILSATPDIVLQTSGSSIYKARLYARFDGSNSAGFEGKNGNIIKEDGTRTNIGQGNNFIFDNNSNLYPRLGIGVGVPSHALHIKNTTSAQDAILITNSTNTQILELTNGGSLILNSTTDGGQRLQVYGDTLLRGSGNTSTTTALTVQNSSSTNLLRVLNDGTTIVGNGTTSTIQANSSSVSTTQTLFLQAATADNCTQLDIRPNGINNTLTGFYLRDSSTGATFSNLMLFGRGNATLPSAGVSYIGNIVAGNPNGDSLHLGFLVSNVASGRFEGLRLFSSGNVTIQTGGTYTDISSSILAVNSTTKGFLPPRMTTTQKNAIATPAAGLVVYDTTDNKHYGYNGTTWNAFY